MLNQVVQGLRSVGGRKESRDDEGSPDFGAIPEQALGEWAEGSTGLPGPGKVQPLPPFKVVLRSTALHH